MLSKHTDPFGMGNYMTQDNNNYFFNKYAFLYTAELKVTLYENAEKVETDYLYVLVHLITMATEWDV